MDGECLPNQSGIRVEGGFDRISKLPDEIIVDILSFLSLKEAAKTSLLSSRWSDLWKHTPILDFGDDNLHLDDDTLDVNADAPKILWDAKRYIGFVNSVIQSHKALCLKQFRISFHVNESAKSAVTKWLEFVFSRKVKVLKLEFLRDYSPDMLVLEELLRESRIGLQPQTDLNFFQSLKSLCLRSLKVSGEDIELFLLKCPLLEQLTIHFATLSSDVNICGATLMLKFLDMHGCRGEKSIKVSAPNLTFMRITDRAGELLFDNAPKLVMAFFEIATSDSVAKFLPSSPRCYFS